MTTYYHVTTADLVPGFQLTPGEWGKKIRSYVAGGPAPTWQTGQTLLWETALETARLALAPHAPSRLDCVFATQTLDGAREFRDKFRPQGKIYAVSGSDEHIFRGDFGAISRGYGLTGSYVDTYSKQSVAYWSGTPGDALVEVLSSATMQVINKVE
jgi:hypothetical protein